jgi:uncharacterized protein (TIGR03067 family)
MLLIVAAVVLLGFAPAPLPRQQRQREAEPDVTGTWEVVLWEDSGRRPRGIEQLFQVEMTRESFVLVMKRSRGELANYDQRLEPSRSPRAFTWSVDGCTLYVGSYRLHNGELTMILDGGDRLEARPTDFDGKPYRKFVLRRVGR